MNIPTTTPTAQQQYEACQDHIWKARGLARLLLEMAWARETEAHTDDRLATMFWEPADLRTSM
jgi:hypothetical protein